jgi:hypothetical protein
VALSNKALLSLETGLYCIAPGRNRGGSLVKNITTMDGSIQMLIKTIYSIEHVSNFANSLNIVCMTDRYAILKLANDPFFPLRFVFFPLQTEENPYCIYVFPQNRMFAYRNRH